MSSTMKILSFKGMLVIRAAISNAIHENFVVFENFNEKKFFLLSSFTIMGFGMLISMILVYNYMFLKNMQWIRMEH